MAMAAPAANEDGLLIPGLPDDVAVQCIARTPRSAHAALSRVSRSWRSVLRSPSLYSLRSDLGSTELILVVRFVIPPSKSLWFELHPNHRSFPIPRPRIRKGFGMCEVAADRRLFLIGGPHKPSARVHIYDSLTRTWSRGPDLSLRREFPAAGLIDGRIYVTGGCRRTSWAWAESLDPADPAASWTPITGPLRQKKLMLGSLVLDGKLVMRQQYDGTLVFDPANTEYGGIRLPWNVQHWWSASMAEVGGVLYMCEAGRGIWGYVRPPTAAWLRVEGELPDYKHGVQIRDFGGLICLVWKDGEEDTDICCATIKISQTEVGRLRGSVVWFSNNLLKVPKKAHVANVSVLEL